MAEYQRIVSYLYKYRHGQKGENVGFVRIDTRPDGLRLFFHIRDLRMMDERNLSAYFYFHQDGHKKGIFVDQFLCSRGCCEYKVTRKEEEIPGFLGLGKMDGMVFYEGEELWYGTCWDERELGKEPIELPGDSEQEKETVPESPAVEEKEPVPENPVAEEKEPVPESPVVEEKDPMPENPVAEEEVILQSPATEEAEEMVPDIAPLKEEKKIAGQEVEDEERGLEKIFRSFPPVVLDSDTGLVEAVKIMPEDIAKFPIRNWHLAGNPFLLQGFETHHELILLRIQMGKNKNLWALGVPGIYDNREKYLAGIFGFYDYIPKEQGKWKTGGEGYWITSLT